MINMRKIEQSKQLNIRTVLPLWSSTDLSLHGHVICAYNCSTDSDHYTVLLASHWDCI